LYFVDKDDIEILVQDGEPFGHAVDDGFQLGMPPAQLGADLFQLPDLGAHLLEVAYFREPQPLEIIALGIRTLRLSHLYQASR
jgi:hypothetical protein